MLQNCEARLAYACVLLYGQKNRKPPPHGSAHPLFFNFPLLRQLFSGNSSLGSSLHTQTKREEYLNIRRTLQTVFYFRSYGDIPNYQYTRFACAYVLLYGQKNQKPPPRENRGAVPLPGLNGRLTRFCKQNGPVSPTGRGARCFSTARITAGDFETLPVPVSARRSPSCGSALLPRFPQGGKRAPTLF